MRNNYISKFYRKNKYKLYYGINYKPYVNHERSKLWDYSVRLKKRLQNKKKN